MGDKGDKSAARPSKGSLVETRCLIKGPKSAILPFAEPRSGPKSRTGSGASQKAKSQELASALYSTVPADWASYRQMRVCVCVCLCVCVCPGVSVQLSFSADSI